MMREQSEYDVIFYGSTLSIYLGALLAKEQGFKVLLVDSLSENIEKNKNYFYAHPMQVILSPSYYEKQFLPSFSETYNFLKNLLVGQKDFGVVVLSQNNELIINKTLFLDSLLMNTNFKKSSFDFLKKCLDEIQNSFSLMLAVEGKSLVETQNQSTKFSKESFIYECSKKTKNLVERLALNESDIDIRLIQSLLLLASNAYPKNISDEMIVKFLVSFLNEYILLDKNYAMIVLEIKNKLKELGVEIKNSVFVESLNSNEKQVTGVVLSSYDGLIKCKKLVLGNDLIHLYRTLSVNLINDLQLYELNQVQPVAWWNSFYIDVDKNYLSEYDGLNLIYLDENFFEVEDMVFKIHFCNSQDDKLKRIVFSKLELFQYSKFEAQNIHKSYFLMSEKLEELFPFLDLTQFKQKSSKEFLNLLTPPESLRLYYKSYKKNEQNFKGLSVISNVSNLYFLGPFNYPTLGMNGEVQAALQIQKFIRE
jgi:hypothetical protein